MTGYVYFLKPVGQRGPVKIGHSTLPRARLNCMMNWSPVPLELILQVPAEREYENFAHRHLSDFHSHHEWFVPNGELDRAIERLRAGEPIATVFPCTEKPHPFELKRKHRGRVVSKAERERMSYGRRVWWTLRKTGWDAPVEYKRWDSERGCQDVPLPKDLKLKLEDYFRAPHRRGRALAADWARNLRAVYAESTPTEQRERA